MKPYNPEKRRAEYLKNKEKYLETNKKWREDNKERHAEMNALWYARTKEANLKKYLLKYAAARAKKKNIPFTITENDIVIPELCPVFKVPLIQNDPRFAPSIDRFIPELGYVKENIIVMSRLANMMKWDSNQEELLLFCKGMIQFLEGGQ